jgi:NAD(P)-dependent dehydrogenase (short-subunit alcohol dehydrogenase family)
MDIKFNNKVVVVTGGGQGIGRAISLAFASSGANVAILDINADTASSVVEEIGKAGGRAEVFRTDISSSTSVEESLHKIIEEFGPIDILVNNAGIVSSRPFIEISEKEWDLIMAVNLKGVFNTARVVFPLMVDRHYGKIVNVASIAGKRGGGVFGNSIYATSKAGVIGLTKALAREGGPYGVNVNAVCPGPANTTLLADFKGERRESFLQGIPMRRFAEPEDVASLVTFLASDAASYITGEISDVDGGIMLD